MNAPGLWRRLATVRSAAFEVEGDQGPRRGEGRVVVHAPDPHTIEWEETGRSIGADGRELPYRDRLRWQWNDVYSRCSLHHLRLGEAHPVHLGDLRETAPGTLSQEAPHLCGEDRYEVKIELQDELLHVEWTVTGPGKQYTLRRRYR